MTEDFGFNFLDTFSFGSKKSQKETSDSQPVRSSQNQSPTNQLISQNRLAQKDQSAIQSIQNQNQNRSVQNQYRPLKTQPIPNQIQNPVQSNSRDKIIRPMGDSQSRIDNAKAQSQSNHQEDPNSNGDWTWVKIAKTGNHDDADFQHTINSSPASGVAWLPPFPANQQNDQYVSSPNAAITPKSPLPTLNDKDPTSFSKYRTNDDSTEDLTIANGNGQGTNFSSIRRASTGATPNSTMPTYLPPGQIEDDETDNDDSLPQKSWSRPPPKRTRSKTMQGEDPRLWTRAGTKSGYQPQMIRSLEQPSPFNERPKIKSRKRRESKFHDYRPPWQRWSMKPGYFGQEFIEKIN